MRDLPQNVRVKIATALANVPKLGPREARDALISGLPRPLARGDDASTDFILIVDRLADEGVSAAGSVPLLIALDRAITLAGADSRAGRRLRELRNELGVEASVPLPVTPRDAGLEAMPYDGVDTRQSIGFFDGAREAAKAVARLQVPRISGGKRDGAECGTGWLIAPGLLLTNHHVVEARVSSPLLPRPTDDELKQQASKADVWFDYYSEAGGATVFKGSVELLASAAHDAEGLDYALLRLTPDPGGPARPHLRLAERDEEVSPGTRLNIIQHANGLPMQFAFRNNFFLDWYSGRTFLHYLTETQPGASGSPVFNDAWRVAALHHRSRATTGAPKAATLDAFQSTAARFHNEGIEIHTILDDLRKKVEADLLPREHLDAILAAQKEGPGAHG